MVANKATLIAQKKAEMKRADSIGFAGSGLMGVVKQQGENKDEIRVKAVINTTNIMDSHDDVHLDGLWNKSLKENKMIMHLQEHEMKFDKVISDGADLDVTVQEFTWKELGYPYEGKTQALVFDSTVKIDRNPFMFKQYLNGRVKNHSVGMRYVKLELAVNDEDYKEEFAVWNKYIDIVANREDAEKQGYFWAVQEAKVIEGSAVPIGSNQATPTLEITEPSKDTLIDNKQEPHDSTLTVQEFREIIKTILK